MNTTAAYDGRDRAGDDDWLEWLDDEEAVDRLLHDVVETLEHDEMRRVPRGEGTGPPAGTSPPADPDSHPTP
ncbi:MAG TPA: hypothetical protein VNH40_06365 [Gaiellaceae bacterium]|nr:hypothetical protein [Gaiellaceae bacterium]